MNVTVGVDDREWRRIEQRLHAVGVNPFQAMKRPVEAVLLPVQAEAQKLAPADGDVSLRSGAQTDVTVTSRGLYAEITFGGLAAKYAEVQHENEDFAHSPAEWTAKFGKDFPDRRMTTRKYLSETVGSTKGGVLTVRVRQFKEAKPRKRKHPITGYTGGQAHFLYGGPGSAWDEEAEKRLAAAILRGAERAVKAATG